MSERSFPNILRFGRLMRPRRQAVPDSASAPQWAAGLWLSSRGTQLWAALAGSVGRGFDSRIEIAADASADVPPDMTRLFRQLCLDAASCPAGPAVLAAQLAEVQAELVETLVTRAKISRDQILGIGVHDPGLWHFAEQEPLRYLSLCDAARLAELTGMNVIDAFPARDLALGGQGGPITALAEWWLLRDLQRPRVLLDLGRTVRLTYLPGAAQVRAAGGPAHVLSFDVGPGTRLLDRLVHQLTGGTETFDAGGRLAVQGRQIPELLEYWLRDPYFQRGLPRWHPLGVRAERFLTEAVRLAVQSDWSVRDLLCTATHFIAETSARAVQRFVPRDPPVEEFVLSGGGKQNGLLLREMAARLPGVRLTRLSVELGIPHETLGAVCSALLALMHVAGMPGNHSTITGTTVPRVLGRLTPGTPQAWHRLVRVVAEGRTHARSLRAAV